MALKHLLEQQEFTNSYIIPYFKKHLPAFEKMNILEIGCAEGGLLAVLDEMGMRVTGLEIEASRVEIAKKNNDKLKIFVGDITDHQISRTIADTFDLIIMRDTIEHIPDRDSTFANLRKLLNPGGYVYVTFPPRFSGFAGHQQNAKSILRIIPFLHLLPAFIIRGLGNLFSENQKLIDHVIQNYHDGLSIRKFSSFYKRFDFTPVVRDHFLFRPVYQVRFKIKPRRFPNVPLLREFFAFGCEYLLQKKD